MADREILREPIPNTLINKAHRWAAEAGGYLRAVQALVEAAKCSALDQIEDESDRTDRIATADELEERAFIVAHEGPQASRPARRQ